MKAASAPGHTGSQPAQHTQPTAEPLPQHRVQTGNAHAQTDSSVLAGGRQRRDDATAPHTAPLITESAGPDALWARVIDLTNKSVRMQALLRKGKPIAWENNSLALEVEGASRSVLERQAGEIESLLRRVAGKKVTLVVRAAKPTEQDPASTEPEIDAVDLAKQQPLVQHAIKVFDGRVETAFVRTPKSP